MCDRDYVIQVEGQSTSDGKLFGTAMDVALRAAASSRRTSSSSQNSMPQCTSPNYDSGNFSCSNTSDISNHPIGDISSAEDDGSDYLPEFNFSELTDDVKQLQKDLREKDQMLLLTLEENRRVKSELERLNKSERWYKNELKSQKRSRLDILEKLYLNERKFVEENQKLKSDCTNLASICSDLEKKAINEKNSLLKQIQELQRLFETTKVGDGNLAAQKLIDELKFDLQKQRENVHDKETLIDVLKKQKQSLLRDLSNYTSQRDSKILNLEASAFTLEQENRKITKNCIILVEEKRNLEKELRKQEKMLDDTKSLLRERELNIEMMNDRQKKQIKELEAHRDEINGLTVLTSNLQQQIEHGSCRNNEKTQLFENYAQELENKHGEIVQLQSQRVVDNNTISQLQMELQNLKSIHEIAKHELEQLKLELQDKDHDLMNLKSLQLMQRSQIDDFQEKLAEYKKLKENFDRYVSLLQAKNETLETREDEIERLKTDNEELQNHVNELDFEIETLRLVVRGQKAQIKRFNCKCAENEEIRRKFEEASNLLRVDKEVFENETCELEHLRRLAQRQAEKIYKLLEQVEPQTVHPEQGVEPCEKINVREISFQSFHSHELEEKALKIERMRSLLEKKSDRISQLNCETDQWIELLTNLRISKSSSGTSTPQTNVVTNCVKNTDSTSAKTEKDGPSSEFISLSNICNYQESNVIVHPPEQNLENDTHSEVDSQRIFTSPDLDYTKDEDRDWRILNNVIQSEHKKKMLRYEIHMRTLLDHIKAYKKKVAAIERKYAKCLGRFRELEDRLKSSEQEKEMMKSSYETEMNHLMTAKIKEIQEAVRKSSESEEKMLEVSRKYEKSQKITNSLKRQLEIARRQFLEMDDYKRISVELKLNLNHFMDDYKKLLNPKDSYKSSIATDEIYDLINRSNNFVPNFDNLANSIDALKGDLKKYSPTAVVGFSPLRKFSLMDELRAADPYQFS